MQEGGSRFSGSIRWWLRQLEDDLLGQKIGRLVSCLVGERMESMRCRGLTNSRKAGVQGEDLFITLTHCSSLQLKTAQTRFIQSNSHTRLEISIDN